jgi:hypothetical protein
LLLARAATADPQVVYLWRRSPGSEGKTLEAVHFNGGDHVVAHP